MARRNRALEWEVLSEEEWERLNSGNGARQDATVPVVQEQRRSFSRLWTIAFVALVICGSVSYVVWRQTQTGLKRSNGGLFQVAIADASRSTPQSDKQVKVTNVETHILGNGMAIVDVTMMNGTGYAYRYNQFYRQDEYSGWQRTSPDVSFWGEEKTAETTYFRWYFRARDQVAVTQVAEQLDQVYIQIRHDLGLAAPTVEDKIVIEVQAAAHGSPTPAVENRLIVSSPLLLITPAQVSEVEALRGHLSLLLIQETLGSAQAQKPVWCIWRPLLSGLAQWQLHNVQPTLVDSQTLPAQALPSLKELLNKDETCLNLPVTRLPPAPDNPATATLAASLFDYVAQKYGRNAVGMLLTSFRHYSTWDDAIPAVFLTSKETFEAGWQEYVLTQRAK